MLKTERDEIKRVILEIKGEHVGDSKPALVAGLRGIHDVVLDLRKQLKDTKEQHQEEVKERKRYKKERDVWKQKCKGIKEEVNSKKDTEKQPDTNLEEERKQLEQNLQKETERCKELEERLKAMRSPEFVDQCRVDKARYQFMERVMQQLYGEDVIKKNFNIESIDFGEQIPQEWIDDTSDAGLVRWIKRHTKKSILDAIGNQNATFMGLLHDILGHVGKQQKEQEKIAALFPLSRCKSSRNKAHSNPPDNATHNSIPNTDDHILETFKTKIKGKLDHFVKNVMSLCSANQVVSHQVVIRSLMNTIARCVKGEQVLIIIHGLLKDALSGITSEHTVSTMRDETIECNMLSKMTIKEIFIDILDMLSAAKTTKSIDIVHMQIKSFFAEHLTEAELEKYNHLFRK